MIFNGKEIPFPAVGKISLYKVLESLEVQSKDKDRLVAEAAKGLLAEVNQYPELREGFENVDDLKKDGFEHVFNLSGGIMAWGSANLPLVKK